MSVLYFEGNRDAVAETYAQSHTEFFVEGLDGALSVIEEYEVETSRKASQADMIVIGERISSLIDESRDKWYPLDAASAKAYGVYVVLDELPSANINIGEAT